jgi:hypothetical protein
LLGKRKYGRCSKGITKWKIEFQKAADTFDVPSSEENRTSLSHPEKLGKFRNVFTQEQENELVEHCLFMDKSYLA